MARICVPTTASLVSVCLLLLIGGPPTDGLRCLYKAPSSDFQTVVNCDATPESNRSIFCISEFFPDGRIGQGCAYTDPAYVGRSQPNCTRQTSGVSNLTHVLNYNYTCCQSTTCNVVALLQTPPPATDDELLPVICTDVSPSELAEASGNLRDRQCESNGFTSLLEGAGPGACIGVPPVQPNSQWDVGVDAPFEGSYLSQDTSPPACYTVAGFVKRGFCGERTGTDKFNDAELGKAFDGKYQFRMCAGSITQALALGNSFSLGAQDVSYDSCLQKLLTSGIRSDCLSIRGRFNISDTIVRRRSILPDCCVTYYHAEPEERNSCNCGGGTVLSERCLAFCCCNNALDEKPNDERCNSLREFMWIDFWLEKMVRDECCGTRLFDQCSSDGDCRDASSESNMVESISALPLCCDFCEDFYNRLCSYEGVNLGANVRVSMKSPTNLPFLKAMCRQKGCRTTRPCNFGSSAPAVRGTPIWGLWIVALLGVWVAVR